MNTYCHYNDTKFLDNFYNWETPYPKVQQIREQIAALFTTPVIYRTFIQVWPVKEGIIQ